MSHSLSLQAFHPPACATSPLRTVLALGCTLLALAGCGGGSSSDTPTPPPPAPLAAPANFSVELGNIEYLRWEATPGATRYELHADPDGSGPLPEARLPDFNRSTGTGFNYVNVGPTGVEGNIYGLDVLSLVARLNASYRLRACDVNGCGTFTEARSLDVVKSLSRDFPSGRAPLQSSTGGDSGPRLSQDGLTLVLRSPSANAADSVVYVFTRASSAQPWEQQAVLRNGKAQFGTQAALSADGGTLAVLGAEPLGEATSPTQSVVYLYQRNGSVWNPQGQVQAPSAPAACTQPCNTSLGFLMALSSDGSVLAASANFSTAAGVGATLVGSVATYTRAAGVWSAQSVLESGGPTVLSMALSADGSTLAMNEGGWRLGDARASSTPAVRVFARQGNGSWTQQVRLAVGIVSIIDIFGWVTSDLALSSDGSTLAVHATNVPGHPTAVLDIQPSDLTCPGLASDGWYIGLYARTGGAWQRQAVVSRGLSGSWALAPDGNALSYGNALFTRSTGGSAWACP
jgi:hypothetical protein